MLSVLGLTSIPEIGESKLFLNIFEEVSTLMTFGWSGGRMTRLESSSTTLIISVFEVLWFGFPQHKKKDSFWQEQEMNDDEEQGFVGQTKGKDQFCSTTCKIVSLFTVVSLFMFAVGIFIGRDTVLGYFDNKGENSPSSPEQGFPTEDGEELSDNIPQPPVEEATVDIEALKNAKTKAEAQLKLLADYYGSYADSVLAGGTGLGYGFNGVNGGPVQQESFQRNVDVIGRVLAHGEPLRLGYIGSSVMCGHDNCYYDSFPSQLERIIGDVFKAAGSKLENRNACQGGTCGDSYHNQIFCFRHMVGDDIDFLFYEWTYFETGPEAWKFHDLIARWGIVIKKEPSHNYF